MKNPENYCQSVFLECIHQNVFFPTTNSEKIEKIPKSIFKSLEKYWWDLKKVGSYSNLGRKNPRKNTENPEQSWKFQEGIKV